MGVPVGVAVDPVGVVGVGVGALQTTLTIFEGLNALPGQPIGIADA